MAAMTFAHAAPARSSSAAMGRRRKRHTELLHRGSLDNCHLCGRFNFLTIRDAATAGVQSFRLFCDCQVVLTVDHRLALSKPALPSAPSKKSFSSVSSPILACSDFTSMAGCAAPLPPPKPKTSAAPPSSCAFHDVI